MIKNLIMSLVVIFTLTACDDWWEGISNSGGDSEKPASTQVASLPTATTSSSATDAPTGSASDPSTLDTSDASIDVAALTESSEAKAQTDSSSSTQPEPVEVPKVETSSSSDKCGVGKYAFITTRNNEKHYDAHFESGGRVRYNLRGGPSGKWSLVGDKMDVYGPFKMPGRKYTTLHMVVSKRSSDCKVLEFVGKSPGGQDLAGRRM